MVLSLAAGCIFMQCRKRKNRAKRAQRVISFQRRSIGAPRKLRQNQQQLLQQQHSNEVYANYRDSGYDDERFFAEKDATVEYNPDTMASMSPVARSKPYLWTTAAASSSSSSASSSKGKGKTSDGRQLNVTTSVPAPPPAHTSPRMMSPDDFGTPSSTVSTRSNAPLLNHQLSVASVQTRSPEMCASPVFGGLSPTMAQSHFVPGSRGMHTTREGQARDLGGRMGRGPLGSSPVQMTKIQTKFAPPPSR